jgi:hypothetical protein
MSRMELLNKLGPPPNGPPPMPPGCPVQSTMQPRCQVLSTMPPRCQVLSTVPICQREDLLVSYRPPPDMFRFKFPSGMLNGIIGDDELEELDYPPGLPPGLFEKVGKSGAHVLYRRIPF